MLNDNAILEATKGMSPQDKQEFIRQQKFIRLTQKVLDLEEGFKNQELEKRVMELENIQDKYWGLLKKHKVRFEEHVARLRKLEAQKEKEKVAVETKGWRSWFKKK